MRKSSREKLRGFPNVNKFLFVCSVVSTFLNFLPLSASACPDFLKQMKSEALKQVQAQNGEKLIDGDICAFYDRYQSARQSLQKQGVNPEMIADARAPRLVDLPTWIPYTEDSYDPRGVYQDPAGRYTVWDGWNRAAVYVDALAEKNFQSLSSGAAEIPQVDLDFLTRLHIQALAVSEPGLAGALRKDGTEIGQNFRRDTARKVTEIEAIDQNEYKSLLHPENGIVTFHRTQCYDELSSADRNAIDSDIRSINLDVFRGPGQDFMGKDGVFHHCGYFIYADASEVRGQLELLFKDIAQRLNSLTVRATFEYQMGPPTSTTASLSEDPLRIAARAQRWFVSVHPFGGGNGRTSRFFMDYILESLGLPAPTFASMNDDIQMREEEWARQIAIGMERVVGILENCATHAKARQCQMVK